MCAKSRDVSARMSLHQAKYWHTEGSCWWRGDWCLLFHCLSENELVQRCSAICTRSGAPLSLSRKGAKKAREKPLERAGNRSKGRENQKRAGNR